MPRLKLGSVNRCDRKPMGFCLLDKAEGARLRDLILGSIPTDVEEEWLLRPKAPSAWGTKERQAVRTGLTASCRNTRVTGWHAHACSAAFCHATPCTSWPCATVPCCLTVSGALVASPPLRQPERRGLWVWRRAGQLAISHKRAPCSPAVPNSRPRMGLHASCGFSKSCCCRHRGRGCVLMLPWMVSLHGAAPIAGQRCSLLISHSTACELSRCCPRCCVGPLAEHSKLRASRVFGVALNWPLAQ